MTSDRWLGAAKLRERSWWVDCETESKKRERGRKGDGGKERKTSNRSDVSLVSLHVLKY